MNPLEIQSLNCFDWTDQWDFLQEAKAFNSTLTKVFNLIFLFFFRMITAAMFDKTFTPAASTLISPAAAWLAEASCVCLCNLPGPLRWARSCLFLLLAQLTASWLVMEAYGSGGKNIKKKLGLLLVGESNGEGFPVWIWLGLGCCERLETVHRVYEWLQCAPLYAQILLLRCIACLLWSRALSLSGWHMSQPGLSAGSAGLHINFL